MIARRQPVSGGKRDQLAPLRGHERARTAQQGVGAALHERGKGGLDVAFADGLEHDEVLCHALRRGLDVAPFGFRVRRAGMHQQGDGFCLGF